MTPEELEKSKQENERIFKAPKRFADNSRVLIAEGHVVFCFYVGENSEIFSLTPHHAKRISQLLALQITTYETGQGIIPASLQVPNIQSPIQQADLKGPESGNGEPPAAGKDKPDKPKKK